MADNDVKLTESGVLLESSRALGSGSRVPLDLSNCPQYSLFPGQLVALEGTNPDGLAFRATRLVPTEDVLLPRTPASRDALARSPSISLVVACGPYALDGAGDHSYEPLDRLLLLALERKADVLILLGPFVDANSESVRLGAVSDLPEALLKEAFMERIRSFSKRSPLTKVVLVPSLSDLTHDNTFPQCALPASLMGATDKFVLLAPNPGVLLVNDCVIALSSIDVLFHLGAAEIGKGQRGDRISRLCKHLLDQSSYYPLHPANDGANIDYTLLDSVEMPLRPHLLVTPSSLQFFAKAFPEHDAIVLNPGQFCRKRSLGTCSHIVIHSPRSDGSLSFHDRFRVDIIQL